MTSANKKSANASSSRSGNTQRRTSGSNTGSRSASGTASRSRSKKKAARAPLLSVLKDSSAGRFLLILVAVICILGLDFLFSLNKFGLFFLFLGIELIAAVLIGWIRFVLRGRSDEDD